ncbi:hypothetical protein SAMN03159341_105303 [Paenibacillus sp. 1_12]|uniref:hypothetical protein n=1 Tax=Paenibacillus sp. 1_12 TaxID=1566278 RepID=UPI0008EA0987|nr:hypothetical protein [Paenibacillus sp. 1_12]SFL36797.1 hypothetical protein SAMN03159341_105303 [Paenibacillus sp. 1_12]
MKKMCIIASVIIALSGCSLNTNNMDFKIRSVNTELTKQSGLEHWKLALLPKTNSLGQQGYDIEFQNTGEASVKSVVVYYRIDTKEKLSGKTVKADSKTVISKLDPNEKITLSDLTLPMDTPISVAVEWLEVNHISMGSGIFKITESK